jgi:hypothetical protein
VACWWVVVARNLTLMSKLELWAGRSHPPSIAVGNRDPGLDARAGVCARRRVISDGTFFLLLALTTGLAVAVVWLIAKPRK